MAGKSKQDSSRFQRHLEGETQRLPWLKLFFVPLACYVPAFLLVFLSFYLFKSVNTSNPDVNTTNSVEAVQKASGSPRGSNLRLENSPLAREYIRAEVQNEVKAQSEQAAKDEIDKLKADWKGDLFGQMAFPILFAIASIFAAFAVKDILTEILKEQEKERLKQELKMELANQIVPKIVEVEKQDFTQRLEAVEVYTYWLEYALLDIEMAQIIDEFRKKTGHSSSSIEIESQEAIKRIFARATSALNRISSEFNKEDLKIFKRAKLEILKSRFSHLELEQLLSDSSDQSIIAEEKYKSGFVPENRYSRIDDIFKIQISLLVTTLSKLLEDGSISQQSEVKELIELIKNYTDRDKRLEISEVNERRRKAQQLNE
ncbi:MAG TPA: hypothetical protein V6C63_03155 [Allocoleopsis sp.]